METQDIFCPICESSEVLLRYSFHQGEQKILECRKCTHGFLVPFFFNGEHYGNEAYFQSGEGGIGYTECYDLYALSARITYRMLFSYLLKAGFELNGKLLEIGSGTGYFLKEAKIFFERLTANDLSDYALGEVGKYANGIILGDCQDVYLGNDYKWIFAFHVVEHLSNPVSFIKRCMTALEPGGHVFFSTPAYDGILRRVLGPYWPSFKLNEHGHFFTRKSLAYSFKKAGLRVERTGFLNEFFPLAVFFRQLGFVKFVPKVLLRLPVWVPQASIFCIARKG